MNRNFCKILAAVLAMMSHAHGQRIKLSDEQKDEMSEKGVDPQKVQQILDAQHLANVDSGIDVATTAGGGLAEMAGSVIPSIELAAKEIGNGMTIIGMGAEIGQKAPSDFANNSPSQGVVDATAHSANTIIAGVGGGAMGLVIGGWGTSLIGLGAAASGPPGWVAIGAGWAIAGVVGIKASQYSNTGLDMIYEQHLRQPIFDAMTSVSVNVSATGMSLLAGIGNMASGATAWLKPPMYKLPTIDQSGKPLSIYDDQRNSGGMLKDKEAMFEESEEKGKNLQKYTIERILKARENAMRRDVEAGIQRRKDSLESGDISVEIKVRRRDVEADIRKMWEDKNNPYGIKMIVDLANQGDKKSIDALEEMLARGQDSNAIQKDDGSPKKAATSAEQLNQASERVKQIEVK